MPSNPEPGLLAQMDQFDAEIRVQIDAVLREIRSDRASGKSNNAILAGHVNGFYADTANWTRETLSMLSASLLMRLAKAETEDQR